MIKVLHLLPDLHYGGVESSLEAGVNLTSLGFQSSVLALRSGGSTEMTIRRQGIEVNVESFKCKLPAIQGILWLVKNLKKKQFSIIHCRCVEANFMGILAAKLLNIKCLIEEIGSPFGRSRLAHIVLRKAYSLADGCIFVSKNVKKEFTELGYNFRNSFVIYNPVKKEFFIKKSCQKKSLSNKKIKIISACRLEKEKNVFAIPDIAFELLKRKVQFDWNIYGEGSLKKQLHHKIISSNTHKHVKLKGFAAINPRLLKKYNVLVLTSKQEGMGIIVAEALTLGLSVVATAVGGIPEIFQSKILKSCLVHGSDPGNFADKIIQSTQPKFTRAFVKHQKLCHRYHPDIYKQKLVSVYKNILKI